MIVKVCGMRHTENIEQLAALPIDMMGFIFYDRSPRFVGTKPAFMPAADGGIMRVGVFVDSPLAYILDIAGEYQLGAVQLYGARVDVDMCGMLKAYGLKVLRAVSVESEESFALCDPLAAVVDYFVFDTPTPGHGGSGRSFDWSVLGGYRLGVPFLLSGGIGPDSWRVLLDVDHPQFAGVDLNSRFETSVAVKDVAALSEFLTNFKQ